MKTSNYIIIAFFTFVIGCMLVFFATSKYGKKEKNPSILTEMPPIEFPLENIHVIVSESGTVNVRSGDREYIKIVYYGIEGETENTALYQDSKSLYHVSNDTLYFHFHNNGIHANVKVYCQKVSSLIAKNKSEIHLKGVNFDHLTAEIDHATLNIRDNGEIKKGAVSISAYRAQIFVDNLSVDTLHIQARKSNINMYGQSQIHLFSAKLENETTLQYNGSGTDKFEVEKDATSKCNVNH